MVFAMQDILGMIYLWLKTGHILFVIFWMAGLFMLPRFLAYHLESEPGSAVREKWIEREARLRRIILAPSVAMVWIFGLLLAFHLDVWSQGWFIAKASIVVLLTIYHITMSRISARLARGQAINLTGKQLRLLNEVPGLAAALIIMLVIVRPF